MKLFKRTTIFLAVFIVLVWSVLFVWVYYPIENVRVSEIEKQQIKSLLEDYNVQIPEGVLDMKVKAVKAPKIEYLMKNTDTVEKAVKKGKLKPLEDNRYSYEGGVLTVDGNTCILEGESRLIEKNTSATALSNSQKLLSWMGLLSDDMNWAVYERQDGILVVYTTKYKGAAVADNRISVMMYGAMRYKVEATPIRLNEREGQKVLPVSVTSALADFAMIDASNGAEIEAVSKCFKTDGDYLTPVWEIRVSDKEVYYH